MYECKRGEVMAHEILTYKESNMITMLINGENITDIAKELNVARQTIYNWMEKDNIKAELDRRRRELSRQGNSIIMKDLTTYINNIKKLAQDTSDKRVSLAANQYLLNRIYGNAAVMGEDNNDTDTDNVDTNVLEEQLNEFKKLKRVK